MKKREPVGLFKADTVVIRPMDNDIAMILPEEP